MLIPALIVVKLVLPGTLGAIKQSFLPAGGLVAEQAVQARRIRQWPESQTSGLHCRSGSRRRSWGQGFGTRSRGIPSARIRTNILDNEWLGTLLELGVIGFFGWLWFFARVVRRLGKEAKEDDSDRGWLLVAIAASIAAFAVGMLTYDAFAFIQVTFLMFVLVGLGAALVGERPMPRSRVGRSRRRAHASEGAVGTAGASARTLRSTLRIRGLYGPAWDGTAWASAIFISDNESPFRVIAGPGTGADTRMGPPTSSARSTQCGEPHSLAGVADSSPGSQQPPQSPPLSALLKPTEQQPPRTCTKSGVSRCPPE